MKYVIRIGVFFLFVTNILLLYLLNRNERQSYIRNEVEFSRFRKLEKESAFAWGNERVRFPLDLELMTLDGKPVRLQDTLKNPAFVMWYPQHNCTLCFRKNLDLFLDVAKSNPDAVILSTKLTVRDLFFFAKKYDISVPCFAVKDERSDYPFREYSSPLFFNLDTRGVVDRLLVHNPDFDIIAEAYFSMQKKITGD